MTETTDRPDEGQQAPKRRAGGLNGMLIADLKAMAAAMGIPGAGGMRKAQLVEAIKAAGTPVSKKKDAPAKPQRETEPQRGAGSTPAQGRQGRKAQQDPGAQLEQRDGQQGRQEQPGKDRAGKDQAGKDQSGAQPGRDQDSKGQDGKGQSGKAAAGKGQAGRSQGAKGQGGKDQGAKDQGPQPAKEQGSKGQSAKGQSAKDQGDRSPGGRDQGAPEQGGQDQEAQDQRDDEGGSRRNRRRRGRDRATGGRNRNEPDTQILEDDVLVPAAGILDVLDNYAFVRTSGYLPGADDVYLSLSMVRRFGLRSGDAVVGQVRQPREGERKEKFNPMVRVDSVNGQDPDSSPERPEFAELTPVHPTDRLRLETAADDVVGRVIDLAAPIGKGQRSLLLAPPSSGKTVILQSIARSIATNNPECHLMVVLVDERPEEVTDYQRIVKGEVIASTFDRPAADHTGVAELAIERAKRLVELGHDVVVLLDSITRLGRAYNVAAPANGRVLPGGIDAGALHPPKRFFGAARNIEDGGSLTVIAAAQVDTGSTVDTAILEELEGTGNAELRLRRELADRQLFPAIDVVASGTRREELLVDEQEVAVLSTLRRRLADLQVPEALELVLERVGRSPSNLELLARLEKGSASTGGS